ASTSHEIRTPMNAILGINDMILNENPEPESRQAALAIKKSGEYLLNLVNNILDISKIEAGKMDLFETDYHLCELLKECEDFVIEKLGKNNNIRFILDVDENMSEHLNGDVLRLKQALINLLDNAVKYTRKGSITLKVQGDRTDKIIIVSFIIQDTGLGMKEENLKHIFEPFERANIAETRSILGAGLGLTLVKNVVDIMNGTINIESSYGEGTKVTMNLYQKIASSDDFTVKEYEQEMMTNAQNLPVEDENTKNEWPDAKILVVDDTPVNLVVAKGMLKDSRAKIETSESGEDALEKMKSEKFDIVFLDHKMPGMDGIETLGRAKKISPDTKYIALTANAGVNARNEYIELGFDDYLPKPFKSLEMIKILKTFLKG
ncbi:MAG: response regulator, partial [Synergistaceae bacterium]|nr:response regulator [Synergistaceae bacterium]